MLGSSGKLYAQIKNGAPLEIFLSADKQKPQALIDDGLAVGDSQRVYAQGRLVLWSAKSDIVDGVGIYPNQNKELVCHTIEEQLKKVCNDFESFFLNQI